MDDLPTRLRRWTHDVDAIPASDLMDEAADAIEKLRRRVTDPMPVFVSGRGNVTPAAYHENDEKRAVCDTKSLLTDAEREAVEWAAFEFDAVRPDNGRAAERAATLRGLLERMGGGR